MQRSVYFLNRDGIFPGCMIHESENGIQSGWF